MKRFLACLLFCVSIFFSGFLNAQQKKTSVESNHAIDSLLAVLKTFKNDTSEVNTLILLCIQYTDISNYEQAIQYAQMAQQQAEKISYAKGIAGSYLNIGSIFWNQGDYEKASVNFFKSLKIYEGSGNKKGIGNCYNNLGNINYNQGNYENALNFYQKCLKIYEELGDKKRISLVFNNIGCVSEKQGNYQKSLENSLKSLKIREELGDRKGIASSYNNIGMIYHHQGNYEKALDYYLKSIIIKEKIGDKQGIGASYGNIGNIYEKQGKYEMALENHLKALKINEEIGYKQGVATSYTNIANFYFSQFEKSGTAVNISDISQVSLLSESLKNHLKSLKIYEEIGNKQGIALTCINIGGIYLKEGKLAESFNYFNHGLIIAKEIGFKEGIEVTYSLLSDLYEKKGDYKQAYNYHKLFSDIKDTLLNEQSSKQIAEMNTKYDSEKKDKELIQKDAQINKQQAETEKQILQRNAFIIGFVLVLVLAFFIFNGYRQKQNANKLLEGKNILIENQKQLVEEKNLKITDSINYAKRIQQAILPSQELIKSFLPDSFIFFRPKDIVSGDFYWFSQKKDKLIIAVADCTGHGVPGAFMSMIGNTLLNEIVNMKNICEPCQILNQLNKGIVSLLHQSNESNAQDDGMDITILSLDIAKNEIEFAGANHFAYLFNDINCETLKGDVFSIGGMFGKSDINFTNQKIKAGKGRILYLFTDGFIDQFGGDNNTKFLSGRFEKLLHDIHQYEMEQQKDMLVAEFDSWKGNNKQLDDILVVGIKI